MTQQYTPVSWQDETTSQQGTLINAERLNQMQQAHHYADGLEEVDAVPTANPGVSYHKIVYCTADSTIYRWDGTEWTKDIDDETKRLLEQEIARATEAEGELAQDLADETTARETADTAMQADITAMQSGKLDKKTTGPLQYQLYGVRGSNQIMFDTWGTGHTKVPTYGIEEDLLAKMPTYGLTDDTVVNYGWATAQIGAEATAREQADTALGGRIDTEQARAEAAEQANAQAIANTYTKAEADTLLAGKASTTAVQTLDTRVGALETGLANVYTKTETDTLLGAKANDSAVVHLNGAETIPGVKTFTGVPTILTGSADANNLNLRNDNLTLADQTGGHNTAIAFRGASDALLARFRYRNGRIDNAPARNISLDIYDASGTAHTFELCRLINNTTESWPALDSYAPMVRTTGNQTIAGVKTFTAGRTVIQDGTTEMIYRIDTTHGTERYAVIELSNPNNNYNACLQFANMPDGTCKLQFYRYNKSTGAAEVRDIVKI